MEGPKGIVVVFGGVTVDTKAQVLGDYLGASSQIGKVYQTFGGVGHNIAMTLSRMGLTVRLVSAIGNDHYGKEIENHLCREGIDIRGLMVRKDNSGRFVAILDKKGDLITGVGDLRVVETFTPEEIAACEYLLKDTDWVIADCNLSEEILYRVALLAQAQGKKLAVEPTSLEKSLRLRYTLEKGVSVDFSSPNLREAAMLLKKEELLRKGEKEVSQIANELHRRGVMQLSIGMGNRGVFVSEKGRWQGVVPPETQDVRDTTGAGDSVLAATLAGLIAGYDLPTAARWGQVAAGMAVSSSDNISDSLSWESLSRELGKI